MRCIHNGEHDMPYRDPQNLHDMIRAVLAFAAMLSGGVGGGLVGGRHFIRKPGRSLAIVVAYICVGAGVGFGVLVAAPLIPGLAVTTLEDALMVGFIAGISGSIALAASNLVFKFSAKKLGIDEASISIKFQEDNTDTTVR